MKLCQFYMGLQSKDGQYYKRALYLAARVAIRHHIVVQLNRPECNIFQQPVFKRSNDVLDGHLRTKKMLEEEPSVQHKPTICNADMEKLHSYFADVLEAGDPVKSTYYCWLNLFFHCCNGVLSL